MSTKSPSYIAQKTIKIQREALDGLIASIDQDFDRACELLLSCQGKIIVIGMGKSGHIGKKISATLASTGSPAFYVHPGEASHGDMGMISPNDIVIAISYSGETEELLQVLPAIKQVGAPIIALTASKSSKLSQAAEITLVTAVKQEACPHNLAPTSSTTTTLVLGDAIAVALLEMRQFSPEDFARRHPGGSLGKQLLLRVQDLMHQGEDVPTTPLGSTLEQALVEVSSKRLGTTVIVDDNHKICGVFTDGDLRRCIEAGANIYSTCIDEVMGKNPKTIRAETKATAALAIMQQHKITSLIVTDGHQKVIGLLHIHDLLRAGITSSKESKT